jgi:hypothetical protein
MISIRESLITSFMAFGLLREEAELAARSSQSNPANNETRGQSDREFFASLMEPIGRCN